MTDSTDRLIAERAKTHGDYDKLARISQALKRVIVNESHGALPDYQQEALDSIAVKIARIVNGDHNHKDTWDDIAGYARLVSDRIPIPPEAKTISITMGRGGGSGGYTFDRNGNAVVA